MRYPGFVILICLLLISGCTQFQSVPPQDVNVGSIVKVHTVNNTQHKLRVIEITDTELVGKNIKIRFDDILSIQKQELTPAGEEASWYMVAAFLGFMIGSVYVAVAF